MFQIYQNLIQCCYSLWKFQKLLHFYRMKKVFYTLAIVGFSVFLFQCTSKKGATESTARKESKKIYAAAKKRWPEITQANLDSGKVIYRTKCSKCHAAKAIASRSEASWITMIDKMSPMAKLDAKQKEDVSHFILAARAAGLY